MMNNIILPEFFIVGAQKSGTTSICSILNHHAKIYVSTPKEPMFFCRDDVQLHSCFFVERSHEWSNFDWGGKRDDLIAGYDRLFHKKKPDVLCGEGSTTYMPSRRVPERIFALKPDAKIIFILRNPVDRAYSAYWHYVYKGVISRKLYNQLRFDGQGLLAMGLYKEYIDHYLKFFTKKQMYFEVFERFKTDKQNCINGILRFLKVDGEIDTTAVTERTNSARVPAFHRVQLVLNELRKIFGARYSAEDQYDVTIQKDKSFIARFMIKNINLLSSYNLRRKKYKKIDNKIRSLMQEYYRRENRGLSELVEIDLKKYWGFE